MRIATVKVVRCKDCPFFSQMPIIGNGYCNKLDYMFTGYEWDYSIHDNCPLPKEKEGEK